MSSRREVLIRIALLQRRTLTETKNRTLKYLKWHYSTVRSLKNVAELTEDGAFALFFCPHPGGFDSSRVPPREFAIAVYLATKQLKYSQGTQRVNKHMVRTDRTTRQESCDP